MSDRFLREPECRRLTGLSRSTRWRLERQRHFPRRRRMSQRTVGWLESELREWLSERPAASSSDGEMGVMHDPESRT
jgi:prophage regulatory protein